MFTGPFDYSIVSHAREKGLIDIEFIDIREFGIGSHKTVDDKPYGGGVGMILKVDVLKKAIDSVSSPEISKTEQKIILLSAKGRRYNQDITKEYSKLKHLIIICGHYEGVDERILDYIDEEISIGDYVLTGGEIPAMAITDSITRLIPGVFKEGVTDNESFSKIDTLEHPHYTRPEIFKNKKVPEILLSGNHKKIEEWKKTNSPQIPKAAKNH